VRKIDPYFLEGILNTDQYQLTMAQLYFLNGDHEQEVTFEHFFRKYPDYGTSKAGYCINAGLEWLISWMKETGFAKKDLGFLRNQHTSGGKRLYDENFVRWLGKISFLEALSIDAIPEGRVVHPGIPLVVIRGPLAIAQLLETALLNQLNYQILVATKASRIKMAGHDQLLLEFGTRRAQDRGVSAGIRASLIGGADFTSNVAASGFFGFEPKGTHSHAMIQFYMGQGYSELEAFQLYADLYPDNCILLVDTISTLDSGIHNAIRVFENLKKKGHEPLGIRLDSGDLAYLSIRAARMLDEAGFVNAKIVLSNELDEINIWQIITQIEQESAQYQVDPENLIRRLVYGVGTRLITSAGDPALSGVYKLTSIYRKGRWIPTTKFSESQSKSIIPGNKKVWRIYTGTGKANADMMTLVDEKFPDMETFHLYHPFDPDKHRTVNKTDIVKTESLLEKITGAGKIVYEFPGIEKIREKRLKDLACLDPGVKRLIRPHVYHVSLSEKLDALRKQIAGTLRKS
jgi:nicotinate phosphoribosyltransferase